MRKIKLMALLLATLMIVSAFAGCAGVKKEELDALDVRVQALEDLLNGQQKDLAEIKDSVNAVNNNADVLEAIESIKKDLEDKIKDVDGRVDEVGKADGATTVSDETKAAQQKALALIEVRRAEFNKVADEYATADYTKISEALGTATGAVNAATTTTAVDAAMAALNAELGKYMTYAMKAYDYYTQLLGGVNADAADLVAEARAFLKEVQAVYDEDVNFVGIIEEQTAVTTPTPKDGHIVELLYLVEDKDNDAKDVYIDIYGAINDLCALYENSNFAWTTPTTIYFENEKGKLDKENVYTLAAFERKAKDLVADIADVAGEEIEFKLTAGVPDFGNVNDVYKRYSEFAELALFLGGEKLVASVTNADKIEAAQATIKNLEDAFEAFKKATKLGIGNNADVFYWYDVLTKLGIERKLESDITIAAITAWNAANPTSTPLKVPAKDQKEVWIADVYSDVDDLLDEWKTTYNLSDKNVLDIIKEYKGTNTYYTQASSKVTTDVTGGTYVSNKHYNGLLVEAYNTFKSDIAPKIIAVNAMGKSVQLVLAIADVTDSIEELVELQKKNKDAEYPATLKLDITDVNNLEIMIRDADIFSDYVDDADIRLGYAVPAGSTITSLANVDFIDLYSFEADINELEANGGTYFIAVPNPAYVPGGTAPQYNVTDNRGNGSVYTFFKSTYPVIKTAADSINKEIEDLVDLVETNGINSNVRFINLEGQYIELNGNGGAIVADHDSDAGSANVDISTYTYTSAAGQLYTPAVNSNVYVNVEKLYTKQGEMDAYVADVIAKKAPATPADWTIFAFLYTYPEFEELLDLEDFNKAKKTMDDRLVDLFAKAKQFAEEVDAIEYVRAATAVIYEDANNNGKYDYTNVAGVIYDEKYEDGDTTKSMIPQMGTAPFNYRVSLEDAADVNAAFATHEAWVKLGGNLNQTVFSGKWNSTLQVTETDVFEMKNLGSIANDVSVAENTIHDLRQDITDLKADASSFIKVVDNIKAVHAYNKFSVNFVTTSDNNFTLSDPFGVSNTVNATKFWQLALKSFKPSTAQNAGDNDGTYGIIKSNAIYTSDSYKSYNDGYQLSEGAIVGNLINAGAVTKEALLKAAVMYYDNFHNMHVEYVADALNDYTDSVTDYYQRTEYVPYAEFDAKVAEYNEFDVLSVKSALCKVTNNNTGNAKVIEFRNSVKNASTLKEIEDIIIYYNSDAGFSAIFGTGTSNQITSTVLNPYAVYNFQRLVDLGM